MRVLPLLLLAAVAWANDDLEARIGAAEKAEEIRALRVEVDAIAEARPQDPRTATLLRRLSRAFRWHLNDDETAVALLERAAAIPDTDLDVEECLVLGDARLEERRYEAAREWLARALAKGNAQGDDAFLLDDVRNSMGHTLEGLGRFEEALGFHEAWRPQTFCGNCNAAMEQPRRVSVDRCRYRVGLVEHALRSLKEQFTDPSPLAGPADEAFALYAEICVREDRLKELRETHGKLTPALRDAYAPALALAEAFAARDAHAVVRAVADDPVLDRGILAVAGRMLDDIGPKATGPLVTAVEKGGPGAWMLAGYSHLHGALPALRARLQEEGEDGRRYWLRWAIVRLEAVR